MGRRTLKILPFWFSHLTFLRSSLIRASRVFLYLQVSYLIYLKVLLWESIIPLLIRQEISLASHKSDNLSWVGPKLKVRKFEKNKNKTFQRQKKKSSKRYVNSVNLEGGGKQRRKRGRGGRGRHWERECVGCEGCEEGNNSKV